MKASKYSDYPKAFILKQQGLEGNPLGDIFRITVTVHLINGIKFLRAHA